ncbi:MAG: DEAD/DEAH box helicase [Deltaproteobacteria bacterium]|nr:DEAD/DEAH box helicase [Deltaproteobacteria bacterium]
MTEEVKQEEETLTFDVLDLRPPVRQAIDDMGWDTPTPVQVECYAKAISGRDLIVQSRTGTGKTAAFGIPIVDRLVTSEPGVQALILAPTRELALQSSREIGKLAAHSDMQTVAIYGGAPMEKQVRALDAGAQIVSGTPGRVLDHLRRGTLDSSKLKVLCLDEADEMLSMGFAEELNAIIDLLPKEGRQTLLFSATVDGPVERIGGRHMTDPERVELSGDAVGALGVDHLMYMVSGKARAQDLVKILEIEDPESAIVFCNTKRDTEQVAAALQNAGYAADWLNGDLAQNEREKVMKRTRASELRFLVATDVAARGIDISHLTHVINFALPDHLEQYIHRTGRTGRAGRTGTAISLVAPQELGTLYYLRLQYKIFPTERSMPSAGEERTRREMDRVAMLQGMAGSPTEIDLAVARRLLTLGNAEEVVAGLVRTMFGTSEDASIDETAAEKRRDKPPAKVADEEEEERPSRRKRKERKERKRPKAEAKPKSEPPARDHDDTIDDEDDDDGDSRHDLDGDEAKLYVSVGRKDGVRVGDLNRLFQDTGGLSRDEVGRIRLRDKHSFVSIPATKVEAVVEALQGIDFHDRELKVEPARAG